MADREEYERRRAEVMAEQDAELAAWLGRPPTDRDRLRWGKEAQAWAHAVGDRVLAALARALGGGPDD